MICYHSAQAFWIGMSEEWKCLLEHIVSLLFLNDPLLQVARALSVQYLPCPLLPVQVEVIVESLVSILLVQQPGWNYNISSSTPFIACVLSGGQIECQGMDP